MAPRVDAARKSVGLRWRRAFLPTLVALLAASFVQGADAAEWKFQNLHRAHGTAGASATATNGKSYIDLGCNRNMGPAIAGTLYDYDGRLLQRVDDESETVSFEIASPSWRKAFPSRMHYIEWERAWVLTDWLPVEFLAAFGAGEVMILRNGAGREVARFGLAGSAGVAMKMRTYCGM